MKCGKEQVHSTSPSQGVAHTHIHKDDKNRGAPRCTPRSKFSWLAWARDRLAGPGVAISYPGPRASRLDELCICPPPLPLPTSPGSNEFALVCYYQFIINVPTWLSLSLAVGCCQERLEGDWKKKKENSHRFSVIETFWWCRAHELCLWGSGIILWKKKMKLSE